MNAQKATKNGTEVPYEANIETIRSCHDEAFLFISQGISNAEQGNNDLAIEMFHNGLEKIDKALSIKCSGSECIGPIWEKARMLQQKMRKSKDMVLSQLQDIQLQSFQQHPPLQRTPDMPPSYQEACDDRNCFPMPSSSSTSNNIQMGHSSVQEKPMPSSPTYVEVNSDVVEVFSIPSGVMVFYMTPDATVSTPMSPSSLKVYKFVGERTLATTLPSAWLQVGEWTYPLIPGKSPALETAYGAFIFPDVGNQQDSASVGIILPADVNLETRRAFRQVISELTAYERDSQTSTEPESFSDTLSRGIVKGAEYLSAGLVKGASVTSEALHKGATKLKEYIPVADEQKPVSPRVRQGLKTVRGVTSDARKVSGFVVKKLGDLTMALGRKIAPHIREQSSRALASASHKSADETDQTVNNVIKVVTGGVQGFSTVFMGLENAARILAISLTNDTVNVVGHRYGEDTAEVVGNALYSVGNVAMTTHNVQSVGAKAIAKRAAKDAGKAVLNDYARHYDQAHAKK